MSAPIENIYKSLDEAYGEAVIKAFRELLESKHLYQFVNVDLKEIEIITERMANQDPHGSPKVVRANIKDGIADWTKEPWILISGPIPPITSKIRGQLSPIELPSVKLSCSSCNGAAWPHNPGYRDSNPSFQACDYSFGNSNVQFFLISFQCQNCKGTPLVFQVKREALKLSLVGRSQFPEVLVPDFIPYAQRKFYRNAIIADQTSGLAPVWWTESECMRHGEF